MSCLWSAARCRYLRDSANYLQGLQKAPLDPIQQSSYSLE
jgi:hypothetical protein